MKLQVAFGQVLRELRQRKGLSQEKLALECGLDRTFVSLLERGQRQPTLSSLFALAEALDVSASELVRKVESLAPNLAG
jgi:transcriptional regulator with XRE-family HTH domain